MSDHPSLDDLLRRLRAGDQDAADKLFDKYVSDLVGLVRRKLHQGVQVIDEPGGIADSVLKSFCFGIAEDRFGNITSWERLWAVLACLAIRKSVNLNKKWFTKRRRRDKEKPWPTVAGSQGSREMWEPIAKGPTEAQAAILLNDLRQLMSRLDDRDRRILELRLQGKTVAEIAELANWSETTVKSCLKKIRDRTWQRLDER